MHIMIDLETMGTSPKAAIVSIGAVAFEKGEIFARFYRNISLKSCMDVGLEVDADTIAWWMMQDDQARFDFSSGHTAPLSDVLNHLARWTDENSPVETVWGNGAAFDNVILRHAYQAVGLNPFWTYKQDRCYRTVKELHPNIAYIHQGVKHNALDDAISQTMHLMSMVEL